jgi:hypothetical protein
VCIGKFRKFYRPNRLGLFERKERRNEMATTKEREKAHGKGQLAMNTPPIVSQQEWEAARQPIGERGAMTLLDAFEDRRMLIACCVMWHTGRQEPWEDSPTGVAENTP